MIPNRQGSPEGLTQEELLAQLAAKDVEIRRLREALEGFLGSSWTPDRKRAFIALRAIYPEWRPLGLGQERA